MLDETGCGRDQFEHLSTDDDAVGDSHRLSAGAARVEPAGVITYPSGEIALAGGIHLAEGRVVIDGVVGGVGKVE